MNRIERQAKIVEAFGGYKPKHCILASRVLDRLGKELRCRNLGFSDDSSWPFHLLVSDSRDRKISLFCSGFSKAIDIQMLKKDGTPDGRISEVRFLTPEGAANYIRRIYSG